MNIKHTFSLLIITLILMVACQKEEAPIIETPINSDNTLDGLNLPEMPFDYENVELPSHFLSNDFPNNLPFQFAAIESDNTPANNPTTNEGAMLGRVLFYEKELSINGTIACASCHQQENGFSDEAVLSLGFDGGTTRRHSMSLTNARFYQSGKFFWDERASSLEEQVLMPFQDPVEMGMTLELVVERVKEQPYASILFTSAFGDDEVTEDRISKALAQFVRSIVSVKSKYDEGREMVSSPLSDFPNFTAEENLGKQIFNSRNLGIPSCNSCHLSEAFIAPLVATNGSTSGTNNGLDAMSTDDQGIFESSGINNHRGKFKVPSLRNVALRAPFMHDGRFATLEEVIDHYSTGIQNHPTLQPFLRDPISREARQYNFSEDQKAALVVFLKILTDNEFISDEKFSDPFK